MNKRDRQTTLAVAIGLGLAGTAQAAPRTTAYYAPRPRRDLVVVDSRVDDIDMLRREARPGTTWVDVGAAEHGLDAIRDALARAGDVAAVHVIAHGEAGAVQLGSDRIDAELIARHREDLAQWFAQRPRHLPTPEVLFWTCETGAGAAGQAFVAAVAEATGADVGASTDRTGAQRWSADWDLEVASGRIDSSLPFERAAALAWPHMLATFTVTNTDDDGEGSLRWAIASANGNPGDDTVEFAASVTGTITLTSGELYIVDGIDINGPGRDVLTVSGGLVSGQERGLGGSTRVMQIGEGRRRAPEGGGHFTASISGLTIADGASYYDYGGNLYFENGGGIFSYNTNLVLEDMRFRGNVGANGGAVWFRSEYDLAGDSTLVVRNTLFEGNYALYSGGAVAFEDSIGAASITGSTFTGNQASGNLNGLQTRQWIRDRLAERTVPADHGRGQPASGSGGAIAVGDIDHDLVVEDSLLSGNAGFVGGGVALLGAEGGTLQVRRSTLTGNFAYIGGGSFAADYFGPLRGEGESGPDFVLENSTISGNLALVGAGAALGYMDGTSADPAAVIVNATLQDNLALTGPSLVAFQLYSNDGSSPVLVQNTSLSGTLYASGEARGPGYSEGSDVLCGSGTTRGPIVICPAVRSSLMRDASPDADSSPNIVDLGGNLFGLDPMVGPLASNGGATPTHRPLDGSPLIDAGTTGPYVVGPDQTGGPRVSGGAPDIGAVEAAALLPSVSVPAGRPFGFGLLALGLGALGWLGLRRSSGGALGLMLALAASGVLAPESARAAEGSLTRATATILSDSRNQGDQVQLRLADGSEVVVPKQRLQVERAGRPELGRRAVMAGMRAGTAAVVELVRGADGTVRSARVRLFDSIADAQAALSRPR
jgi:predicted outer membrane repeat protein